jgi:hypothetical protein
MDVAQMCDDGNSKCQTRFCGQLHSQNILENCSYAFVAVAYQRGINHGLFFERVCQGQATDDQPICNPKPKYLCLGFGLHFVARPFQVV